MLLYPDTWLHSPPRFLMICCAICLSNQNDILAAQTKDKKTLPNGSTIAVHQAWQSTLYVTNFPESADDAWVRELFGQVSEEHDEAVDPRASLIGVMVCSSVPFSKFVGRANGSKARDASSMSNIFLKCAFIFIILSTAPPPLF